MRIAVPSSIFDRIAPSYDGWYRSPLGKLCDDLEKEAIFALAKVKEGDHVLDANCGTGNYAIELARRNAKVAAIDSSQEMLKIASQKFKKENLDIEFNLGDIQNLPFPSNSFDLVLLILGLEFTTRPERAIGEILRVLKPGGRLVIGVLNKYSIWTLVRWIRSLFRPSIWSNARFLSTRQLIGLLTQKSCDKVEVLRAIYFPPTNWKFVLRNAQAIETLGYTLFPKLSAFAAIKCVKERGLDDG